MAAYLRPTVRAAGITVMGGGLAHTGYNYYNTTHFFFNTAHAESLPSDSQAAMKKVFPGKGFTELKLQSAEMVNHNVRRLTFALPDDESITGLEPVTSLLTRHTPEGAWIPVFRPYTPYITNEPGSVSFLIKRYPQGKGSGKMHSLQPGDTMRFKPLAEFSYKLNEFSHMTFVAGGSGITPIYQLTRAILRNPDDKTKISLIYANNTEKDILLKSELEDLERQFPGRFQKLFVVGKPEAEGDYEKGHVTKEILQKVMPNKIGERNVKVLVSGPPPMTTAIAGAKGGFGWTQGSIGGVLGELGYTKEEVYKF